MDMRAHHRPARTTLILALLAIAVVGAAGVILAAPAPSSAAPKAGSEASDFLLSPLNESALFTQSIQYVPFMAQTFNAPSVFGVEMSSISQNSRIDLLEQAGVYWVRKNGLLWSAVQPTKTGGYQWSNVSGLEVQLRNAAGAGLHTVLIIRSTPSWAQRFSGVFCGPMKTQYFDKFGKFVAAAARRYSGAPYYVHHYELWNEPDVDPSLTDPDEIFGCWGDKNDSYYGGEYYGDMLKVVYPLVKAASPSAQVLVGGLLLDCDPRNPPSGKKCLPAKFLEGILVAGAKDSFDGVSFHAYDYYNWVYDTFGNPNWNSGRLFNEVNGVHKPVLIAKVDFITEVLATYNASDKFLLNTEVALLCGSNDDPPGQPGCDAVDTSPYEIMKTAYLAQAFVSAMAEGLPGNFWFSMRGWRNSGLIYTDSSPRPAYDALDFSQDMLWNATYLGKVTGFLKVKGYRFARDAGSDVWIMWATDGTAQVINLTTTPLAIWDSSGNPVTITGTTVTLDVEPYYIEMP